MNKLAKTLILFPAVMLLASCDISDLGIPQTYNSFKTAVEKIKDHEYSKVTITGYSGNKDDLTEVYHYESGAWVADAENTTSRFDSYIITAQEMTKDIGKNFSDSKISANFKFYIGINVYKIEYSETSGKDSASFTYKYNQYGYPTYFIRKSSSSGNVTSSTEAKFSYE